MKPSIENTGLRYKKKGNGLNDFYHTFEDFHVIGEPIDDDYNMLAACDDFVYVSGRKTSMTSHEVFAKFEQVDGDKIEYISLYEIMMSGSPIDLDRDEEMDLLDENIYQVVDGEFVVIKDL